MHKNVFFCFDYQDFLDLRISIVNNQWLSEPSRDSRGFFEQNVWLSTLDKGEEATKKLLRDSIAETTVTVVLIGTDTFKKKWVRYVISYSLSIGHRIVGIHINGIQTENHETKELGLNPFDFLAIKYNDDGTKVEFIEKKKGNWIKYEDLPYFTPKKPGSREKWGKAYKLSKFLPVYDWTGQNGFENLSYWINK